VAEEAAQTASQELQRLEDIRERVAEIHQELIKPPKKEESSGGAIATALIGAVLIAAFQAFCIATLWGWFVVPVFNVPEISIVRAAS
jgi:transposase